MSTGRREVAQSPVAQVRMGLYWGDLEAEGTVLNEAFVVRAVYTGGDCVLMREVGVVAEDVEFRAVICG